MTPTWSRRYVRARRVLQMPGTLCAASVWKLRWGREIEGDMEAEGTWMGTSQCWLTTLTACRLWR